MKNKKKGIQFYLLIAIGIMSLFASSCKKDEPTIKKDPIITWSNPADITVGTLLSATQLNAKADVAGTFVYTPPIGTTLSVGANQDLKVDFTPTDIDAYNTASKTVKINVTVAAKIDPEITWSNPADISYGTLLSSTQLNATADVPGTFVYTPAIGAKLEVGDGQDLKVDFTPSDLSAYNVSSKTVKINVVANSPSNIQTVNIPAGTFTMGSPTTEVNRYSDEVEHQVTLSAFRMSKYEITNAQYATFLNAKNIGSDGKYAAGAYPTEELIYASSGSYNWGLNYTGGQWVPVAGYENHPVINVTWYGATEFATYAGGTLPTESQWEYACRGNTTTPFNTGACLSNAQANYNWAYPYNTCTNTITVYLGTTQTVGSYTANAYGLHDMHGNVFEWCSDWYGVYPTTAQTNPTGATTGSYRVIRGGSWYNGAQFCRSAFRNSYPDNYNRIIGFRVVLVP